MFSFITPVLLALLFQTQAQAKPIPPLQVENPEDAQMLATGRPKFGIAQPRIFESNSVEAALNLVDADTMYITDIDNTVLKSAQMFGSEPAGVYFMNKALRELGLTPLQILTESWKVFTPWRNIRGTSTPVEPEFAKLLKVKQQAGTHAIALSASMLSFMPTRQRELDWQAISFAENPISDRPIAIAPDIISFDKGILLTSYQDKGESLLALFFQLGWLKGDCSEGILPAASPQEWRPKKIVYIDDHLKLNVSVSKALTQCKVPHLAIRYGAADSTWATFQHELAEYQLAHFQKCAARLDDVNTMSRIESKVSATTCTPN